MPYEAGLGVLKTIGGGSLAGFKLNASFVVPSSQAQVMSLVRPSECIEGLASTRIFAATTLSGGGRAGLSQASTAKLVDLRARSARQRRDLGEAEFAFQLATTSTVVSSKRDGTNVIAVAFRSKPRPGLAPPAHDARRPQRDRAGAQQPPPAVRRAVIGVEPRGCAESVTSP